MRPHQRWQASSLKPTWRPFSSSRSALLLRNSQKKFLFKMNRPLSIVLRNHNRRNFSTTRGLNRSTTYFYSLGWLRSCGVARIGKCKFIRMSQFFNSWLLQVPILISHEDHEAKLHTLQETNQRIWCSRTELQKHCKHFSGISFRLKQLLIFTRRITRRMLCFSNQLSYSSSITSHGQSRPCTACILRCCATRRIASRWLAWAKRTT